MTWTAFLHFFMMVGDPVSWFIQKQSAVALLSAEAEHIALSSAIQKAMWLRRLLTDIEEDCNQSLTIMEENQGAIAMTMNPME